MTERTAVTGWLEVDRARVARLVTGGWVTIGRDPACDVVLDDPNVSWRHASVAEANGAIEVDDLDSTNGTLVDGMPILGPPARVNGGSVIRVGDTEIVFRESAGDVNDGDGREPSTATAVTPVGHAFPCGGGLTIGRAPDNDIVLPEPTVSRHHAEIEAGRPVVRDLGSRFGTRLRERRVGRSLLEPGDEIGIASFRLRFDGEAITVLDERAGMILQAIDASVRIGGKTILAPTSLQVAAGEFVALIGPSGSGKTTLLRAMAGIGIVSAGRVLLGGGSVELRLSELGYVPQSETVHEQLTPQEALHYAARLRLPSDTVGSEIDQSVTKTLETLQLDEHRNTRIRSLSGGERRRAACGVELVGQAPFLLLDEPTSGLDPQLERLLMGTLRRLADEGRGVLVVTHATSSLDLCDTLAIMGTGGHLRFCGPPRDALAHFKVSAFDTIYETAAHAVPDSGSPEPPRATEHRDRVRRSRALSGRSFFGQALALSGRYARTLTRERRTLALLLGQVPVIALLISLLFPSDLLARPDLSPSSSAQFLFLMITAAVWLGLISSCREIVKERSILLREHAVGVRLDAYLFAKVTVLFGLVAIQAIILTAVCLALQALHEPISQSLALGGLLVLTGWVSATMGLAVSSLARSSDQATSVIPLLLIPQLLLAGAFVPVRSMEPVMKALSSLVFARWAYAGAGSLLDLTARLGEDPSGQPVNPFGDQFFTLNAGPATIVLIGFASIFILTTAVLISRQVRQYG